MEYYIRIECIWMYAFSSDKIKKWYKKRIFNSKRKTFTCKIKRIYCDCCIKSVVHFLNILNSIIFLTLSISLLIIYEILLNMWIIFREVCGQKKNTVKKNEIENDSNNIKWL